MFMKNAFKYQSLVVMDKFGLKKTKSCKIRPFSTFWNHYHRFTASNAVQTKNQIINVHLRWSSADHTQEMNQDKMVKCFAL